MSTTTVRLDQLHDHPLNPRGDLGDLTEMTASMRSLGIVEPLVVVPNGEPDQYFIVCGHRRRAAAVLAELTEADVVVRNNLDDAACLELMLVENMQRAELNALEEARAFAQLVEFGQSQKRIATTIGCAQSHVSKRLKLLVLPDKQLADVVAGELTVADAVELAKVADRPELFERAVEHARPGWRGKKGYHDVSQAVETAVREAETAAAIEAETAKWLAEGYTVVDEAEKRKRFGYNHHKHGVEALGFKGAKGLKKHAELDCHLVVVVSSWSGDGAKAEHYCTAPKKHPKKPTSEDVRQREERREWNLLKQAAKSRAEWTAETLVSARIARTVMQEHIAAAVVAGRAGAAYQARRRVQTWLGDHPYDVLWSSSVPGSPECERLAFLLVLGALEDFLSQKRNRWDSFVAAHFKLLVDNGYRPTEIEQTKLEAIPPDQDDAHEPEAACRVCGCTEDQACEGGCSWAEDPETGDGLCSRCVPAEPPAEPEPSPYSCTACNDTGFDSSGDDCSCPAGRTEEAVAL